MNTPDDLASGLFFIVGSPRSGTTLLQAMLSSHPRLATPPETKFFQKHDPALPRHGGDPLPADRLDAYLDSLFASSDWREIGLPREELESAIRAGDRSARSIFLTILSAYQARVGRPRLGEKTPLHARCVPRIRSVFPDAKFIHIHRDPRDVVASMLQMQWTQGTVRSEARTWRKTLCEHLRCLTTLPPTCYTGVRFETLVEKPEEELRRLCEFLGESFNPAMLEFHDRETTGYHQREEQWKGMTRRPLTNQSIGRFKKDLTRRQIAQVERIVGPLLERFGYESHVGRQKNNPHWIALDELEHIRGKLGRTKSRGKTA